MKYKAISCNSKNYNEISSLCKESGEFVFLTKNAEGDLVVMDIAAYTRREHMLRHRSALMSYWSER